MTPVSNTSIPPNSRVEAQVTTSARRAADPPTPAAQTGQVLDGSLDWLHPSLHDGFIPLDPTTPLTAEQLAALFAGDVQGVAREFIAMLRRQGRESDSHVA